MATNAQYDKKRNKRSTMTSDPFRSEVLKLFLNWRGCLAGLPVVKSLKVWKVRWFLKVGKVRRSLKATQASLRKPSSVRTIGAAASTFFFIFILKEKNVRYWYFKRYTYKKNLNSISTSSYDSSMWNALLMTVALQSLSQNEKRSFRITIRRRSTDVSALLIRRRRGRKLS